MRQYIEEAKKRFGFEDLIFIKSAVKRRDDGYEQNHWFRIGASDDVLLMHISIKKEAKYEIKENYLKVQRDYRRRCQKFADENCLPIYIILAVGLDNISNFPKTFSINDTHELINCGIVRRKKKLREVLGDELSQSIDLDHMGQLNTKRLAKYIVDHLV